MADSSPNGGPIWCRNGKALKRGVLFRSGHLAAATEEDLEKLQTLGLRTYVDLREGKDFEGADAAVHAQLFPPSPKQTVEKAEQKADSIRPASDEQPSKQHRQGSSTLAVCAYLINSIFPNLVGSALPARRRAHSVELQILCQVAGCGAHSRRKRVSTSFLPSMPDAAFDLEDLRLRPWTAAEKAGMVAESDRQAGAVHAGSCW